MSSLEHTIDRFPMLNKSDAEAMGRLNALGLALPNDPVLRRHARDVAPGEIIDDPYVRSEADRMLAAAHGINAYESGFGGLAHNQLIPTDPEQPPLNMMIAGAAFKGANIELTSSNGAFQFLYNTTFTTPANLGKGIRKAMKVGCFSGGITSVSKLYYRELHDVRAYSRDGKLLRASVVKDFPAASLQHEANHLQGIRDADGKVQVRNLVSRDELENYCETITPGSVAKWGPRQSAEGWHDMTHNPDYDFFPTEELRVAFEAGRQQVLADRG